MSKGITSSIRKRITKNGPGWCFTAKDFLDLGNSVGIRVALFRLEKDHFIRRLAPGIYEYPRIHEVLGPLPPQIDQIARAISEKNGIRIQPSGAYAANIMGLTEQVPAKVIFLTNGTKKKLKIGKLEIVLKEASEKTLHATGKVGLAIQAIKNLGKAHIDEKAQNKIRRFLTDVSKKELTNNLKHAPLWVRSIILHLTGE